MEPDHASNIQTLAEKYPDMKIVASAKALSMIPQFFTFDISDRSIVAKEGETLSLGQHTLQFFMAPMVHWPEVMVSYEQHEKVLFSADGFGKFGALDAEEDWDCEARRYYFNIVGKYGMQVQALLKKAATLDIQTICPLHGPILKENLGHYIGKYDVWSSYQPEDEGVFIAYASIHGHTAQAAKKLAHILEEKGAKKVVLADLCRSDLAECVEDAFRYSHLVLASASYDAGLFPPMEAFLHKLRAKAYQNRVVALVENGSWAPLAAKLMRAKLETCKNITFAETTVTIRSALNADSRDALDRLVEELCRDYIARSGDRANKNDLTALFRIGYGLYVVTSNDGKRDNGLIVNTVSQVSDSPNLIAVNINKQNYSYHVIKQTGKMNVNCLSVDAPFSVFENFGFRSGRNTDKFENIDIVRSDNGLAILPRYINAAFSLKVEQVVDLGTHGMFICSVTEARVISDRETMTYSYYFENVKPKPATEGKKGYVCKICGYVYEGDELPEDFICPLCKHGAADFEPIA